MVPPGRLGADVRLLRRRQSHPQGCQTADLTACDRTPRFRVTVRLEMQGELAELARDLCEQHADRAYNGALTLGLAPTLVDLTPGVDVACADVLADEVIDKLKDGERER